MSSGAKLARGERRNGAMMIKASNVETYPNQVNAGQQGTGSHHQQLFVFLQAMRQLHAHQCA
jgi:hypothetical protein